MPAWLRGAWMAAVAGLVLGPGATLGQWAPEAPQDSAPPAPRPIPADSVPETAQAAGLLLSGLRAQLPTDSVLARLDSILADIAGRFAAQAPRTAPDRLGSMYYEELVDLEAVLGQLQSELTRWSGEAGAYAQRVAATRDTLRGIEDRWRATRERSWRDLPPALRAQVSGMLRLTDSLSGAWQPILDRVLGAQSDGAALAVALGASREGILEAQDRVRRELLRRDSRPLWEAFGPRERIAATDSTSIQERPDRLAATAQYLAQHTGRIQVQLALFAAAALLFWGLGRQRERWVTAEYAMHWPSNLLAHPVAAGLVLALTLTRVLHPGAPLGILGLGFLLMLPGLIVLLRPLLDRRYRAPAYLLVGLWAVRVLASTFEWPALAARAVLLALAAAGAATMLWLARVAREDVRARRLGWALAQAGAGLLGAAFVANVLGYVVLADLLVSATLTSGLTALALIALADVVVGAALVGLFATPAGQLRVIRLNRDRVIRRVRGLLRVAAGLFWLSVTLRQFRVLGPVLAAVSRFLGAPLTLGSWEFTVGEILVFVVSLVVAVYVARGLRAVLRHDVLAGMDRGVPEAASSIVYYLALALGVLFAAGAAGIELGRLAIVAGALGVGIGFGLQTIVANFIAGLILLFERPIKPGDTVELEGLTGEVQATGIRASIVRTFQGADVIVPNQDLIAGRVINWTLSDQTRRVDVPVGVAYETDPGQVMAILHEVVSAHPKVLPHPVPAVLFMRYGESSLDFEVRFWSRLDEWLDVRSEILVAIYEAFTRHGVKIPFPQRDLHIRSGLAQPPGNPPAGS